MKKGDKFFVVDDQDDGLYRTDPKEVSPNTVLYELAVVRKVKVKNINVILEEVS